MRVRVPKLISVPIRTGTSQHHHRGRLPSRPPSRLSFGRGGRAARACGSGLASRRWPASRGPAVTITAKRRSLHGTKRDAHGRADTRGGSSPRGRLAARSSAPLSLLAALVGNWRSSSKRDFAAVLAGDKLEFRVLVPSQHPRQGYEEGRALCAEPRPDERQERVRRRRPSTPHAAARRRLRRWGSYAPRGRQFDSVKGKKLLAQFDGTSGLTVDFVQIPDGGRQVSDPGQARGGVRRTHLGPRRSHRKQADPPAVALLPQSWHRQITISRYGGYST